MGDCFAGQWETWVVQAEGDCSLNMELFGLIERLGDVLLTAPTELACWLRPMID